MTAYVGQHLRYPYLDECPDYEAAVGSTSRSNTTSTRSARGRNVRWMPSEEPIAPLNISHHPRQPPSNERYLYTYNLVVKATPLQFFISVEPLSGKPMPGKYTFRLSFKTNGVERDICEPQGLVLQVDPRQLEFAVFTFPGKTSVPVNSLYSLRVWLRVNGIDHRIFADDELWVGKDLDFNSVADASFMRLKSLDSKEQIYHGFVGKALVTFICRWTYEQNNLYKYSLDYEANGVGGNLFDDLSLRIDGDPRTVTFLIYSVPITSTPPGSSHRLRVWLKTLVTLSANDPTTLSFNDSHIYQRIWKTDMFKIGSRLAFESMGSRATIGFVAGPAQTISVSRPLLPIAHEKRHGS